MNFNFWIMTKIIQLNLLNFLTWIYHTGVPIVNHCYLTYIMSRTFFLLAKSFFIGKSIYFEALWYHCLNFTFVFLPSLQHRRENHAVHQGLPVYWWLQWHGKSEEMVGRLGSKDPNSLHSHCSVVPSFLRPTP